MIRDDLAGLSVLLVVAEKRSFTAAAVALGVTPSAVSQTVSGLEERLGVRLLQRNTRSVGLTEAGERFLARLRPAVADVRASFEALDELRAGPAGTLRLNVPQLASREIIGPMLAAFLAAHPDIRVDVTVDNGLADLVGDGFDAGIRIGEALDREVVAVRIGPDMRMVVVGSPAYFRAHGKPKHPRDLHEHACINYRLVTSGNVYRWEFTENGKDLEIAVTGRVVVNDPDLMTRAAVDGVGLVCTLDAVVRRELADKRLVRVLAEFCPPFPGMFLYYPSRAHTPRKLQALVDFLRLRKSAPGSRVAPTPPAKPGTPQRTAAPSPRPPDRRPSRSRAGTTPR